MDWREEFEITEETVAGRRAVIALPPPGTANGKWALKTEYYDAFPAVQCALLRQGYHVAHISNKTRWHCMEDDLARAALVRHMQSRYGASEKCVIIGMSCGGLQGIYFASDFPQYVSCMYLDAPVVNFLSCPAGLGKSEIPLDAMEEFQRDTGMGITELLSYRDHPLDRIPSLVKHNVPIILVSGDSDITVPYEENGKLLEDAYVRAGGDLKVILKPGGDHHPHSLEDNTPILDFIRQYDK